ncbi:hypothetical protein Aca07nite_54820 [Actinoplanes capillaceus]|uniref:Uncharacterized protein n=2 Tax=Actinoplanes campanulatus TaxID=113559 RepID=A0ABQ3WPQ6_9ACTN|nr:hypothetical protein Aca07nite_54820 [Actinoplanes capillaceus]
MRGEHCYVPRMFERNHRGPIVASAVLASAILLVDAVVALLMIMVSGLPLFAAMTDAESGPGSAYSVLAVLFGAVLAALSCPAAATMVAGVRTPAAHLTGWVVTASVTVGVAGLGALGLRYDLPSQFAIIAGALFVANVAALIMIIGLLHPGGNRAAGQDGDNGPIPSASANP